MDFDCWKRELAKTSLARSLFLRFNGHFPDEPGLAGLIEAKDDGGGGDNWSHKTCKPPVKWSPQTNQHPTFLGSTP